jgi:uncharacterized membrane protein HdeD (DUF308 family)
MPAVSHLPEEWRTQTAERRTCVPFLVSLRGCSYYVAQEQKRELHMGEDVEVVEGSAELDALKKTWWLLALLGVLSIGFGLLLIFWPSATLTTITAIVGLFMIITGVIRFFVGVFDSSSDERWLLVFMGIIGVALGVIILKNPEATIKVIVLITAVFWLIGGMVDVFRGIANSNLPDRGARIALGALSVLFGAVLLVWPAVTVGVFAILMGIYVVIFGLIEIVAAFQIRNA